MQHKVSNWTNNVRSDVSTDVAHPRLDFEVWNWNGGSPSWKNENVENVFPAMTLPKILKDIGYRTIHVGKAHFGTPKTLASNPKISVLTLISLGVRLALPRVIWRMRTSSKTAATITGAAGTKFLDFRNIIATAVI